MVGLYLPLSFFLTPKTREPLLQILQTFAMLEIVNERMRSIREFTSSYIRRSPELAEGRRRIFFFSCIILYSLKFANFDVIMNILLMEIEDF